MDIALVEARIGRREERLCLLVRERRMKPIVARMNLARYIARQNERELTRCGVTRYMILGTFKSIELLSKWGNSVTL